VEQRNKGEIGVRLRQSTRIPKALGTEQSTVRTVLELPRRLMIYLLCWQHRVECPEFGHSAFSSLSKSEKSTDSTVSFLSSVASFLDTCHNSQPKNNRNKNQSFDH
jgi:hypothetical protein